MSHKSKPKPQNTQTSAQLARLMGQLASQEGTHPTALPGVSLTRISQAQINSPSVYEPSIIIVGQGIKRCRINHKVYTYDPHHYLALSVPLPAECDIEATPEKPLICLSIEVKLITLSELLMEMAPSMSFVSDQSLHSIGSASLSPAMRNACIRLLKCLKSPVETRVLGPSIVREIIYHVLCGEQGTSLRAAAARQSRFGQISRVLHHIHSSYAEPMDIRALASEANMSTSVFHQSFKAAALTTPIQYIKAIRLHKARMLMIHERISAASAASRVGYESASQFSREYKRAFGRPPSQDTSLTQKLDRSEL